jgi:Uncharacterized protein conserved in bacteria
MLVALFATADTAEAKAGAAAGQNHDNRNISKKPFINGHYVLSPTIKVNGYHPGEPVVVVVDKGSHFTHVLQLQNDTMARVLTISNSIGHGDTPTPPGRYLVTSKTLDPKWVPPKTIDPKQKPVEPYSKTKENPLGVAKISLDKFEVALHGTNAPPVQMRKNVSHGCVRHSNRDIIKLYGMVKPGTVVYIVNQWRGKVLSQADFQGKKTNIASKRRPNAG